MVVKKLVLSPKQTELLNLCRVIHGDSHDDVARFLRWSEEQWRTALNGKRALMMDEKKKLADRYGIPELESILETEFKLPPPNIPIDEATRLVLSYWVAGATDSEIAEITGYSESTVQQRHKISIFSGCGFQAGDYYYIGYNSHPELLENLRKLSAQGHDGYAIAYLIDKKIVSIVHYCKPSQQQPYGFNFSLRVAGTPDQVCLAVKESLSRGAHSLTSIASKLEWSEETVVGVLKEEYGFSFPRALKRAYTGEEIEAGRKLEIHRSNSMQKARKYDHLRLAALNLVLPMLTDLVHACRELRVDPETLYGHCVRTHVELPTDLLSQKARKGLTKATTRSQLEPMVSSYTSEVLRREV